jgi:hypothetical protein
MDGGEKRFASGERQEMRKRRDDVTGVGRAAKSSGVDWKTEREKEAGKKNGKKARKSAVWDNGTLAKVEEREKNEACQEVEVNEPDR